MDDKDCILASGWRCDEACGWGRVGVQVTRRMCGGSMSSCWRGVSSGAARSVPTPRKGEKEAVLTRNSDLMKMLTDWERG
jgi:hypothetical protein